MRASWLALTLMAVVCVPAWAEDEAAAVIPMRDKGAATFYVEIDIEGVAPVDFLVDTGAGYMTVNQDTIDVLKSKGLATYVKQLEGILADGSRLIVPVYRLDKIDIGGNCELRDVEAAVFPGSTRGLLGLSALRKAGPVSFSFEPPALKLGNCLAAS